ncbi:MAG: AAA family ATPase [Verrucomicrobia bacterium]|nr:AAA family ATPase [Verrucomicrobiota bacterium]MBU6446615.1 AAA family ATPase [Verrucomicrobiota bacterium]MDE3048115.1 AAA family ATPase [Verrucomicrobiota bacterium]
MKSLFVAATGQNVGKTTTCLGLVSGLIRRHNSVGFIKPVGQEYIEVETGLHVDKDVLLFKSHFELSDPYEEMSPVLFPRGFTRDFLDGRIDHRALTGKIEQAHRAIAQRHAVTVIEGTGHTGVGSIVDLNNAQVAALLKAPVLLVASGGLGSSFDELTLNYFACEKFGAKVAGVILNRVLDSKRDMILDYVPKALARWNVPLLGCIPYTPFLSTPTMGDFEILFQTKMLAGAQHRVRHFQSIRLVAGSVEMYRSQILSHELIITPAIREDIILAALTKYWDSKIAHPNEELELGLILTGKTPPKESIVEQIRKAGWPVLYAPLSSFAVMKMVNSYTSKFRKDDPLKIKEAIQVVETHIDFEKLGKALQL